MASLLIENMVSILTFCFRKLISTCHGCCWYFQSFRLLTQLSLTGIFPRIYRYVQIYFRGDHPWIFSLWPPQHFTIPKLNYLTDHAWKLQGIIYGERSKEIRYCLVWIINVSATVSFLFKFWEDNFFQAKNIL